MSNLAGLQGLLTQRAQQQKLPEQDQTPQTAAAPSVGGTVAMPTSPNPGIPSAPPTAGTDA